MYLNNLGDKSSFEVFLSELQLKRIDFKLAVSIDEIHQQMKVLQGSLKES